MTVSKLESRFLIYLRSEHIPAPVAEYRFVAEMVGTGRGLRQRLTAQGLKDWRYDFAWPEHLIAVEIEGGTWSGGRHNRGRGYAGDCEKYNRAMGLGWQVYRLTADHLRGGNAHLDWLLALLRVAVKEEK